VPETNKSFVKYTENGFNIDEHINLFNILNKLNDNSIDFMLSNSDVKLIHENFKDDKYIKKSIICKRTINSKNPNSKTKELIIINY
jgi:DNA adenine methylase